MGGENTNPKNNEPNEEIDQILNKIRACPMDKYEIEDLYKKEDFMCFIKLKTNNTIRLGTGFFCNYKSKNIPFQNALFTNNHVLNKENIELGKK